MELPYVDQHTAAVAAPREVVWRALEQYIAAFLRRAEDGLLTRVLGAEPRAGFEIAERAPPDRLTLVGHHRFARYQLPFDLTDAARWRHVPEPYGRSDQPPIKCFTVRPRKTRPSSR